MRLEYQSRYDFRFTKTIRKLDYPPHLHNAVELVFLRSGKSLVTYGTEKAWLHAGEVFVSFPGQIHAYEHSEDIEGSLLIIPVKPYLEPYYSLLNSYLPTDPILSRGQWEHTGVQALLEEADQAVTHGPEGILQGYFIVLLGKLLSLLELQAEQGSREDALRDILMYIHDHYLEPLTRSQIAQAVGYNESYVSHIFSQALQMSIPEYIHGLRVEDAQRLLRHTSKSVIQIGEDLGFGSIRSFNRVFLRHTGLTPTAYRKK